MEKKTLGSFIAALRKANGMTQAELAEKLHVSDKTVSRWERDDSAPDLNTIPVLAEIFHVTCDELLRGQRAPAETRPAHPQDPGPTVKSEKQQRHLLALSMHRYQIRSLIAAAVMAAGLLAAMAINFGLLRARLAFLAGTLFWLAGALCQAIFVGQALFSVSDIDADTGDYRYRVHRTARWLFGLDGVLLCAALPLLSYINAGLLADRWLLSGALCALAGLAPVLLVCRLVTHRQIGRGDYPAPAGYARNYRLQRTCALGLAALLALTVCCHGGYALLADREGKKQYFDSADDFIAYMEQDVPYPNEEGAAGFAPLDSLAPRGEWKGYLSDGTAVVGEFYERNRSVYRYASQLSGGQKLYVITYDSHYRAQALYRWVNTAFFALYPLETVAAGLFYLKKREKGK